MEEQISDIENYLVNFQREIIDEESNLNTSAILYTSNNILSNGESIYNIVEKADDSNADSKVHESLARAVGDEITKAKELAESDESLKDQEASLASNYQAVTLVPSEIDENGELRYMLIPINIQPDKCTNKDSQKEMSVFDFQDEPSVDENMKEATDISENKEDPSYNPLYSHNEKGSRNEEESMSEEEDVLENDQADDHSSQEYTLKVESIEEGDLLKCNYCDFSSTKRFRLARHLRSHSTERPFKCDFCSFSFKNKLALNNHHNTHKGIRPSKCKECEASFTTTGELLRHVRYKHTYEKPHRCTVCNYASVELSKLRRHNRSHTGERPYKCTECPYASPDSFKLKRHLRVHTGERPYECEICGMKFTQSNSLKSHRLIHSGSKPIFQCELCPSTCTRKTDLRNHVLRIHTSDKPLLCKKCGKNFPDRYTYKMHSRTHDGQKCFKCELCPYSSSVHRHLENHMLTHTGERPFECLLCGLSFRQKTLLGRHCATSHKGQTDFKLRTREKIHQCAHCDKAFANEGSRDNHVLRCHEDDEGLAEQVSFVYISFRLEPLLCIVAVLWVSGSVKLSVWFSQTGWLTY